MKIGVIGSGTIGSDIAQTLASKHEVIIRDTAPEQLGKVMQTIDKNLSRSVKKERTTEEEKQAVLTNIKTTDKLEDVKDCDLVIEAATKNAKVKKQIFIELCQACDEKTILASNTSPLSITDIGAATQRLDKVIGMHFFNPVPMIKSVEVIRRMLTSDGTNQKIIDIAKEVGKTPVQVDEAPGLVVNRILVPVVNEGIGIYVDGIVSAEDIDTAMKLGADHLMGPLGLGDLIGPDVYLAIMNILYTEFGDSKYRAHPLLKKMVRAGRLGRRTGQGFYDYRK